MAKLHKDSTKYDLIETFNNTYRYLDDIFALNNSDFFMHTYDIYPKELTLNKANNDSSNCPFLDLDISISQSQLKFKIYDKRDDFSFPIVNVSSLAGTILWLLLTVCIFLNLFVKPEFVAMFPILMNVISALRKN